ncbi:hypothetical protein GE061_000524 [Apolygus lucorum]|uniref:Uncharacterized protein n=1 Tax=Apolygus lucorum TaxID=248454 RepID=A0A8S9Y5U0_APOLU|nr:hypothetical protein GE061_000524 [Apolygus lucorum]
MGKNRRVFKKIKTVPPVQTRAFRQAHEQTLDVNADDGRSTTSCTSSLSSHSSSSEKKLHENLTEYDEFVSSNMHNVVNIRDVYQLLIHDCQGRRKILVATWWTLLQNV